ncbi:MAG: hypothetical protein R3E08_01770 [Thiotrichaceae bacterium]
MLSSTSSSNDRLPRGAWDKIWIIALCIVVILLTGWEIFWRLQGFVPSLNDDANLWAMARSQIPRDNKQAIVLAGSSRMQLGIDTRIFAQETGIAPVQLAIDGTTPLPILADLAADEHFIGIIICELSAISLVLPPQSNTATEWLAAYQHRKFSAGIEYALSRLIQKSFIFRLPDLQPSQLLEKLRTGHLPQPFYLTLHADRSRAGDYLLLDTYPDYSMMAHYRNRVARHYTMYQEMLPIKYSVFQENVRAVQQSVATIQQRGGRVIFVRFPSSGEVWKLDEQYLPRTQYWDEFARQVTAKTLHFKDFQELQYELPDGSHLDYRQATPFTRKLIKLLGDSLIH